MGMHVHDNYLALGNNDTNPIPESCHDTHLHANLLSLTDSGEKYTIRIAMVVSHKGDFVI